MKRHLIFLLVLCGLFQAAQAQSNTLYQNDFEKAEIGKVPDDFLVLDGRFAVRQADANKFLELPGSPIDGYSVQFGPADRGGLSVFARIRGTSTGRRYPTFGVGLNGVAGHRLQVNPARKLIELFKDQEIKATAPFDWKPGQWTGLRLRSRESKSGGWIIEARVWTQSDPEPNTWMVSVAEPEQPNSGRASVFGSPFSKNRRRFFQV